MDIRATLLEIALNSIFNKSVTTYQCRITFTDATASVWNTVDFNQAVGGSVAITTQTFFAVAAGKTVDTFILENNDGQTLLTENLTQELYSIAGTYSINSVTVTLSL